MPTYADDRRIDQFCHDLAIALRRISGKSAEIGSQDIPSDSGKRFDICAQPKPANEKGNALLINKETNEHKN